MAQRLNYRHLHYFCTVAREGHLTRAAEQLHVSQSALSAQIRQLEQDMGCALFERTGRSLVLTEAGRMVLNYGESIFALGGEMMEAVQSGHGQALQQLRVGAVATLSRNFLENFLRPVMRLDDLQLVVQSGGLDELTKRLAVHKLDLVLSNRPVGTEEGWRCRRVARQPVCLIGPRLGRNRRFRFPEDLAAARVVLPGHTSDIRIQFDLLCEELDVKPNIHAEVDDMATLRLLARDSGSLALLPAVVVQDELKAGVLQQYCEVPKVVENFYAITTERRFQPRALQQLLREQSRAAAGLSE